jgi:hypothetical protein
MDWFTRPDLCWIFAGGIEENVWKSLVHMATVVLVT